MRPEKATFSEENSSVLIASRAIWSVFTEDMETINFKLKAHLKTEREGEKNTEIKGEDKGQIVACGEDKCHVGLNKEEAWGHGDMGTWWCKDRGWKRRRKGDRWWGGEMLVSSRISHSARPVRSSRQINDPLSTLQCSIPSSSSIALSLHLPHTVRPPFPPLSWQVVHQIADSTHPHTFFLPY